MYKQTEEHKKKLSQSHKGKIHSEETKSKISKALKNIKKTLEHKNRNVD